MRFRLRTLLIVLAVGPPMLAAVWWFTGLAKAELNELQRPFLLPLGLLVFEIMAIGATCLLFMLVGLVGYCLSLIVEAFIRLIVPK